MSGKDRTGLWGIVQYENVNIPHVGCSVHAVRYDEI